jgi:hypothetical protein
MIVGKSPIVRERIEPAVGLPLSASHFKIVPEVLILDKDNNPKVSTQLVQTKPLFLGAELKCFLYFYAFH